MELRRYLAILRQRALLIAVTVAAALVVAWMVTPRHTVYTSSSTVYVGYLQFDANDNAALSSDRLTALNSVLLTYSIMVDSRTVAAAAIDQLGLARSTSQVVAQTSARAVPGAQLLVITVSDPDPVVAMELADAMAFSLVAKVNEVQTPGAVATEGQIPTGVPIQVFERASLPTAPRSTGLLNRLFLAALFGFVTSAALAFALDYLDVTVRNAADAERRLGMPVLGVIPMLRNDGAFPALVRTELSRVRELREAENA